MENNGFEKLISRMIDREYAEMADLPEDMIYEEILDDEDALVDEKKDEEYYEAQAERSASRAENAARVGEAKRREYERMKENIERKNSNS